MEKMDFVSGPVLPLLRRLSGNQFQGNIGLLCFHTHGEKLAASGGEFEKFNARGNLKGTEPSDPLLNRSICLTIPRTRNFVEI